MFWVSVPRLYLGISLGPFSVYGHRNATPHAFYYDCYGLFCRNLSLVGGVVLLLAESLVEARSSFAGLPSTGENKMKEYLQVKYKIGDICRENMK